MWIMWKEWDLRPRLCSQDIVDSGYAGDEENVFASGDFDSLIGEVLLELTTCFVAAKFKYLQEIDRRTFRKTFFDQLHESV